MAQTRSPEGEPGSKTAKSLATTDDNLNIKAPEDVQETGEADAKKKKRRKPNARDPVKAVNELNGKYAVVLEGGKVRVLTLSEQGGVDYISFTDFKNLYMHQEVLVGRDKDGNDITMSLGSFWLRHAARKHMLA